MNSSDASKIVNSYEFYATEIFDKLARQAFEAFMQDTPGFYHERDARLSNEVHSVLKRAGITSNEVHDAVMEYGVSNEINGFTAGFAEGLRFFMGGMR